MDMSWECLKTFYSMDTVYTKILYWLKSAIAIIIIIRKKSNVAKSKHQFSNAKQ